jgi:hypothetical protein
MKGLLFALLFVLATGAFAETFEGADGWVWSKYSDPSTKTLTLTLLKHARAKAGPQILVVYQAADKQLGWGLFSTESWGEGKTLDVTYSFDAEPAVTGPFVLDRQRVYTKLENMGKFAAHKKATVVVKGKTYEYDLVGLDKTFKMILGKN